MWASLNDRWKGEPRCPLVPKLTRWAGSLGSGRHAKYARSSRARSTSIAFGAGLPASGEIPIRVVLSTVRVRPSAAAPVFQFQRHETGDGDRQVELPDNRLQIGQAASERIDWHDIAIAGRGQRGKAE